MATPSCAHAHSFTGTVTRVIDGDTVLVTMAPQFPHQPSTISHQPSCKVRLAGIDAPEKNQPYGKEATKALADMVLEKQVRVVWQKKDRYRRIIGSIRLMASGLPALSGVAGSSAGPEQGRRVIRLPSIALAKEGRPLSVNEELVRHGHAWHYVKYSRDKSLARLETEAKTNRIGLWKNLVATPPWRFRKHR
ncbi:thermonuclease family protein [Verrucomicrobiota bacterium]